MRTALCAMLPLVCWSQTNSITITESTGAAQTNYPVQIGRPFKDSEILNFPQVVCGGTPLTTQADVKKRYGSGYVQFALVAFLIPSLGASAAVTCTFQNQASGNNTALTKTQMLDAAYDFGAGIELTAPNCTGCTLGGLVTASGRTMLNDWDGTSDSYTGPVWKWTQGTVAQTMIFASHAAKTYDVGFKQDKATKLMVALKVESTSADYSVVKVDNATGWAVPMTIRLSSVNSTAETSTPSAEDVRVCVLNTAVTPHELTVCGISNVTVSGTTVTVTTAQAHGIRNGNRVTITGVKKTGDTLWAYVNGYWKVTVTGASTFTYTSTSVGAGPYLSGGIYGRGFNDSTIGAFGAYVIDVTGNPAGAYVFPNYWLDAPDSTYKSFRPIVHATFWPTINKVRVRFIGEVADSEKFADQIYKLVLKTGNAVPATRYDSSVDRGDDVTHRAGSRWTKEFWIGGAPTTTKIDHNLAYLKVTKWSWNLDTDTARNASLTVSEANLAAHYALWTGNLKDIYDFANLEKSQGSPSLDNQDGPIPVWNVLWLRTFDNRMRESSIGHAELGASWYIHMREGNAAKNITRPASAGCPNNCDANGLGRVLSVTSRPKHFSYNIKASSSFIPAADKINIPGGVTVSGTSTGGFRLGLIHVFEPFSTPFMLTGDPFYLEELWFWAGYSAAFAYGANDTVPYARGPLNLGYGVAGVPMAKCLQGGSTTLSGAIGTTDQIISVATQVKFPSLITYVNMVQPATSGVVLKAVSSSASDTNIDAYVVGLRAGVVSSETILLNGTTEVSATSTWTAVYGFKIRVRGASTPATPVGTITLKFPAGNIGTIPGPAVPVSFLNHPINDTLKIVSSSTSDTSARFDVKLFGTRLGSSVLVTETLTLNGTTHVLSAITDWEYLYAVRTLKTGTGTDSRTFGTISVKRDSDSLVVLAAGTGGNGVFPYTLLLEPGGGNQERVRVLGVDVAGKKLLVERAVGGSALSHSSGSTVRYEETDTNDWEIRTTGWIARIFGHAAYMSPDNTPEGSYFTSVIRDQFATLEGQRGLAASLTDAGYTAVYNWSINTQRKVGTGAVTTCNGIGMFSTLGIYDRGAKVFSQGWPDSADAGIYGINESLAWDSTNGFGTGYLAMGLGRLEELGFPGTTMMAELGKLYNGVVNSVTSESCTNCPYTVLSSGRHAGTQRLDHAWPTTFAGMRALYDDGAYSGQNWQGKTSFSTTSSYVCISAMAGAFTAKYATGGGGAQASAWLDTNLRAKVTYTSADLAGSGNTCSIRWAIAPRSVVAAALNIDTTSLPAGTVGTAYSQTVIVSGGTSLYTWSLLSGALPAGLTLTGSSGVISGTPTATGTSNFTIRATDAVAAIDDQALSIIINAAATLVISTASPLPAGTQNVFYSTPLAATGGVIPYTWSITVGSLPTGLTINSSTGTISGTPTDTGLSSFTGQAAGLYGTVGTKAFTLTINSGAPPPPNITTTSLPDATVGLAYSQTAAATGGTPPYTWSVFSGSLPAGLTLGSSTGTISGTPTTAGSSSFTLRITDSASPAVTDDQALSILTNAALAVTTAALVDGAVDVAYTQALAATGGTPPYTWSVLELAQAGVTRLPTSLPPSALPPGISLVGDTLTGTPTTAGTFAFTVQVTDGAGSTASQELSLVVAPILDPLVDQWRILGISSTAVIVAYQAASLTTYCTTSVSQQSDYSFPVQSTDDAGFITRAVVLSGLTASAVHYVKTVCGAKQTEGTFNTPAVVGGTAPITIGLRASPALTGVDNVLIEYGTDKAALNLTATLACPSGCSVTITPTVGVIYLRWKWRNVANAILATSEISTHVVQ